MVYHYEFVDLTSQGLVPEGIVPVLDEVLTLLSINDDTYLMELKSLYESLSDTSEILDMLGSIFGLRRNLTVTYLDNGVSVTEELNLDDNDFLTYIKCQIIKNNFDGSYKQFKAYYELAGLTIGVMTKNTVSQSIPAAHADLYLINIAGSSRQISSELRKLFLSGNLTLSSAGIEYSYNDVDLSSILVWKGKGLDGSSQAGNLYWNGYDLQGTEITDGGLWL